jgi:hypothetical protein
MSAPPDARLLRPLVGDLRQLASVRSIALDDGPERGVRALAFSTGGGLDFWALLDRSFDLGPLWWRGVPLAWQAPSGFAHPSVTHVEHDGGQGASRLLSGLLMTCGLDHVRQPAGPHPMHGRLPMTPARLLASGESWDAVPPALHAQAEVVQARLGAECLRLTRRITAPIRRCELTLTDTVTNDGGRPQPHDILYHFNLGYPGIDHGSTVTLNGEPLHGPLQLADPSGTGEARCVPCAGQATARVQVETRTSAEGGIAIELEFDTATLPHLQVWQDLRPRCGLLAIEPCATPRLEQGRSAPGPILAPGESRHYRITLRVRAAGPRRAG